MHPHIIDVCNRLVKKNVPTHLHTRRRLFACVQSEPYCRNLNGQSCNGGSEIWVDGDGKPCIK